jgi:hypothetical protein
MALFIYEGVMKLLFKTDGIVDGKVEFVAGQVYEISDEKGSASRWIKRGAEIVDDGFVPAPKIIVEDAEEEIANEESKEDNKKGKSKIKGL